MNFTAIDFETANAKRSSACSIGMVKVKDGEVVDTFYSLIRPEPCEFNYINVSIHGITPEMVADAKTFVEQFEDIKNFIGNDVLVAHNVSFEQSVINQILSQNGKEIPNFEYLCTLYLTRINYPHRIGYKLDDVCKDLLGLEVNHHHALEDAKACAELAVHHIAKFPEQPLGQLMKALYVTPQRQKEDWRKMTGIKPSKEELDPNHPYFDKRFVLTGTLATMSREGAVQMLVNVGGIYQEGITKSTDYLLVGNEEVQLSLYGRKSNKVLKVEDYNNKGAQIAIIDEKVFLKTIVV